MRTRIKICGITRPEDAMLAAELGADAIGLNFLGGSRKIDIPRSKAICHSIAGLPLPPRVVALCGIALPEYPFCLSAGEVGGSLSVDAFQVYGHSQSLLLNDDESPPYWMAHSIASRDSITNLVVQLHLEPRRAQALLFDAASEKLGGTGRSFNWQWIAEARGAGELEGLPPVVLAGGLNAENVGEAIRIAKPWAVDVASGVEVKGKPGVKDPVKLRDFIQAVRAAGA